MNQPSFSTIPAASAVSLTTATPANVAKLTLSSGTYLVWGNLDATLAGATLTALLVSLSLTSAALAPQTGQLVSPGRLGPDPISQLVANLVTASGTQSLDVGPTILTVLPPWTDSPGSAQGAPTVPGNPAPTATVFLVGQASFSAGAVSIFGSLFALPLPS
jgi:hypothetical protein